MYSHPPPEEVRPYLFGARLVALVKKDGGLRPIACGEILRRLCGKVICNKQKDRLREILLRCSQVGVGVPAGADAMYFAARDAASRVAPGYAIVKLDFKNAFNEVHRSAILAAVADAAPEALQYAAAAYSRPSWLLFGDRQLSSAQGVQQGDPLGPAFFSLALADLWKRVPQEDRDALDITAFFLDDGFLSGPPAALDRIVKFFEDHGPPIGIHLNKKKTEFIGTDADAPAFARLGRTPIDAWDLLGAPCGNDDHKDNWSARLEEKVRQRVRLIAALPPHPAFALLSKCGPSALTTFAARMLGPSPLFAALDAECRAALSKLIMGGEGGLLDLSAWATAQMPIRFGGCGIRNTARHAAIAHVAAYRSALLYASFLRRELLPPSDRELEWIEDTTDAAAEPPLSRPLAAFDPASLADGARPAASSSPSPRLPSATTPPPLKEPPRIATCPNCPLVALSSRAQHQLRHLATVGTLDKKKLPHALQLSKRGPQHIISALLEEDIAAAHLVAVAGDVPAHARAVSATAKYAATWLNGCPGIPTPTLWLEPPEFAIAVRHRLGLPVSVPGSLCALCRKVVEDSPNGDHALCCLAGGLRTLVHHALAREIHVAASTALMQSSQERQLATSVPTRADVHILDAPDDASWVLDIAVTHPLQKTKAPTMAPAAAGSPGGAASLYIKDVKQPRYAVVIAELNSNPAVTRKYEFRPVVVDTFGAWAPESLPTLQAIASRWSSRTGERLTMLVLMHRLSFALIKGLTRLLITAGSIDSVRAIRPHPTAPTAVPAATLSQREDAPEALLPAAPPPARAATNNDNNTTFLRIPPQRRAVAPSVTTGPTPGNRVAAAASSRRTVHTGTPRAPGSPRDSSATGRETAAAGDPALSHASGSADAAQLL
jgi:hypothetical protein